MEAKRILKEVTQLKGKDGSDGIISFEPVGDAIREFKAKIQGPPDTPYCGIVYALSVSLPPNYPWDAPKVKLY